MPDRNLVPDSNSCKSLWVIPLPLRDSYARMCDARTAAIEAYATWLREDRPSRDDAEMEAEGFASVLRQLATIGTRGGK